MLITALKLLRARDGSQSTSLEICLLILVPVRMSNPLEQLRAGASCSDKHA